MLYGLPVRRRVLVAFVLSGALAGLAGVLYAARYGTVSSGAGTGIELQAVAAVVIGGVAIFGGSGTVWGAAIGAVLLVTINRALPILGIPDFWQRAVVGVLILGAIVLDRVVSARQARKLLEARDAGMSTAYSGLLASPCWRRLLRTRETAVIALLVAVVVYALANVRELRRPADAHLPAPRHRADPADRAADDAGHRHRRDRPVGRQRRRAEQRAGRRPHRRGLVDPAAVLAALVAGLVCGALNGFLVAYVGLPSLAVTIGTLALFRGIAVGLLGTKAVTDFPEKWTDLATAEIGETGVPLVDASSSCCSPWSSRCSCTSPASAAASTTSG